MWGMWAWLFFDVLIVFSVLVSFFNINIVSWSSDKLVQSFAPWILWLVTTPLVAFLSIFILVFIGRVHYRSFKLWRWWKEIKPSITKVRVAGG